MLQVFKDIEERFDGIELKLDSVLSLPIIARLESIEKAIKAIAAKGIVDTTEYEEPKRVTENDEAAAQRESA
jgi:hypothetical protein